MWHLFRSKTVWGAIGLAVSQVLAAPVVTVSVIVQAVGTVLAAAGVRDALQKVQDASSSGSSQ